MVAAPSLQEQAMSDNILIYLTIQFIYRVLVYLGHMILVCCILNLS